MDFDIRIAESFQAKEVDTRIADDYVTAEIRRRLGALEMACVNFCMRTRLPLDEITLVHFKGKTFPQWKGAVSVLKRKHLL